MSALSRVAYRCTAHTSREIALTSTYVRRDLRRSVCECVCNGMEITEHTLSCARLVILSLDTHTRRRLCTRASIYTYGRWQLRPRKRQAPCRSHGPTMPLWTLDLRPASCDVKATRGRSSTTGLKKGQDRRTTPVSDPCKPYPTAVGRHGDLKVTSVQNTRFTHTSTCKSWYTSGGLCSQHYSEPATQRTAVR